MGLLNRGQSWLTSRMPAAASPDGAITYQRKADASTTDLTGVAWPGRTLFSRVGKEGAAAVVWGDRDYLIPVTALGAEPARGDRITEVLNGESVTFEVRSPTVGEPEWRYSDEARTAYRVHCVEV